MIRPCLHHQQPVETNAQFSMETSDLFSVLTSISLLSYLPV
ncbi:MAG: hypothetical protein K0Q94_3759 [Paenibacillus sp.]|jgi:hypothetical protein|nr:hypothetical protein [Paenibacillus sp.]